MLPREVLEHVDQGKSAEMGTSSNAAVGCHHPCWVAAFSDELFEVTHAPAREPAKGPLQTGLFLPHQSLSAGNGTHSCTAPPSMLECCLVPVQATVAPVGAQVR